MDELEKHEEFDLYTFLNSDDDIISTSDTEIPLENELVEYKEIEEPCVALTIIGENRLTDTEVFVRRGIKYSIKAFFSTLVLTVINMFI